MRRLNGKDIVVLVKANLDKLTNDELDEILHACEAQIVFNDAERNFEACVEPVAGLMAASSKDFLEGAGV